MSSLNMGAITLNTEAQGRPFTFGTAYRINSTNQVDFHFGFGLSPAMPQRFFAAGYSFRIDRIWGK